MPKIKFTANLKRFYPELKDEEIDAADLQEVLNKLQSRYKGIKTYIVDEQGQLRKHVNIFIGDELIQDRINLSDPITPSDEIYIMQALSGG